MHILSPASHSQKKHPVLLTSAKSLQNTLRSVLGYQHANGNPQPQDSILKSICPSNRFEHTHFNIILQSFHYIPSLNILLYTGSCKLYSQNSFATSQRTPCAYYKDRTVTPFSKITAVFCPKPLFFLFRPLLSTHRRWPLIFKLITFNDKHTHSVGLPCNWDRPVAETSI